MLHWFHEACSLLHHCMASSGNVLVSSGAALISLKPGMELSQVERGIWKEERFLKQPLKGKF